MVEVLWVAKGILAGCGVAELFSPDWLSILLVICGLPVSLTGLGLEVARAAVSDWLVVLAIVCQCSTGVLGLGVEDGCSASGLSISLLFLEIEPNLLPSMTCKAGFEEAFGDRLIWLVMLPSK